MGKRHNFWISNLTRLQLATMSKETGASVNRLVSAAVNELSKKETRSIVSASECYIIEKKLYKESTK